jgi:thiamine biosynthesis lipoprotein
MDETAKPSGWSRRGFLSARGLAASAGGAIGAWLADGSPKPTESDETVGMWHVARRAMACEFDVAIPPSGLNAIDAAHIALDEIAAMDELLTVYDAASPMSYVNQHAADRPVRVDQRLFRVLEMAAALTSKTTGAFDVATHALINAWGFFRGPKRVPADEELAGVLACCGMDNVELDAEARTVHFRVPGLGINLGSIGKGYAIDRAVRRMQDEYEVHCALVQGGLSSVYGLGAPDRNKQGWLIGIQSPFDPTQRVATVRLRDRALGTTNAANQYFERAGRRYGHVIDPRTGRPADTLGGVSVIARDGATADALATALFVMGLDKAVAFCKDNPDIGAVLVDRARGGEPSAGPRVVTCNLTQDEVNLCPGERTGIVPASR